MFRDIPCSQKNGRRQNQEHGTSRNIPELRIVMIMMRKRYKIKFSITKLNLTMKNCDETFLKNILRFKKAELNVTSLSSQKCIKTTSPDERVETESKFSPPPTFNVDNQVIFSLFVEKKTLYFPTFIRGNGGYMIQLKCSNYFWTGL